MTSSFPITPSTHSLPSSTSASDKAESAFLSRTRSIHFLRLGLATVLSLASIATIVCEAIPLRHYRSTKRYESTGLALWPLDFDLRPTIVALTTGCVVLLGSLGVIMLGSVPFVCSLSNSTLYVLMVEQPKSKITPLNILTTLTAVAGFVLSLTGLILEIYKPSSSYPAGFTEGQSLKDWTCKWAFPGAGVVAQRESGSGSGLTFAPPVHFERDCRLSKAGFGLLGALLGLEVLMAGVAVVGVWIAFVVRRERRLEEGERRRMVKA